MYHADTSVNTDFSCVLPKSTVYVTLVFKQDGSFTALQNTGRLEALSHSQKENSG